eukprot:gene25458-34008_t
MNQSVRPQSNSTDLLEVGNWLRKAADDFPAILPPMTTALISIGKEGTTGKAYPKLDFNEDYYSVLEVSPTIPSSDLKKAYYKIVFKYHPDNKVGDELKALCNKQMMVINAAYKVLRDVNLRAAYDAKRAMGQLGAKSGVKERVSPPSPSNSKAQSSTKTGPRPQSTSPPPPPPRARAAPPFSSSPFNFDFNSNSNDDLNSAGESLLDILGDMFTDLNKNGGAGMARDFALLLEGLEGNAMSQGSEQVRSTESLAMEIKVLDAAIKSTQDHLQSLQASLSVESALNDAAGGGRGGIAMESGGDVEKQLQKLQEQLHRKESLSGLKARVKEAQAQLSQLQLQRAPALSAEEKVERELQRLKEMQRQQKESKR